MLRDVVQKNLVDSVELVSSIERRFRALQNSTFCVGLRFSKICDGLKIEQHGRVGAVVSGKSTVVWEIDVTR